MLELFELKFFESSMGVLCNLKKNTWNNFTFFFFFLYHDSLPTSCLSKYSIVVGGQ